MTAVTQNDINTTIRSLQPLREILRDQPALLESVQARFKFSLDKYHSSISQTTFKGVLQYLRSRGIVDIGYRMGWSIDVGTFGIVDFYLHSCGSMREALAELLRLSPLIAHDATAELEIQRDFFMLRAGVPDFSDEMELVRAQALAAMTIRYIQLLKHDPRLYPSKTETPITQDMALPSHSQYMGPNIHYGAPHFAIYYPRELLDEPLRNSNLVVRKALKSEIEQALKQSQQQATTQQRLLDWLCSLSDLSRATQSVFAESLGISESSLKRRLADEATSFSEVLNGFRRSQTLQLLADEQNKIEYIARVLGFSERSAFERAFRQWFTITPAQFRFETIQCKLQSIPEGGALDKLPPLPKIAQEIVALMQKEQYDMRQLVLLVQQEPVLSARVLGLANSAYYGAGRVQNLNDAISRVLGTDTVRNLVLVSMCSEPFQDSSSSLFDRTQHWLMAFGVAQLAQSIAKANKSNETITVDTVQLLGLLHNLGVLLLAYTRPKEMDVLLTQAETIHQESEWTAHEMRLLGIDRYIAATVLLTHWHLPPDLCRRMRQLSDAPMGSDDPIVEMVYQAIEFVASYLRLYTSKEAGLTESKQKQLLMDFFVDQISARWKIPEEAAITLTQKWLDALPLLAQTAQLMK